MTGPGGPARQRVRAEGACSLPMAAIALAAMMGSRRSAAAPPSCPASPSPVTGCCFRCILTELRQAAITAAPPLGPSSPLAPLAPRLSLALVNHLRALGADGSPGIWGHHGKWEPQGNLLLLKQRHTWPLGCPRCNCFPVIIAFLSI